MPISVRSAGSAARLKCFSSHRCSTRPAPRFSAEGAQGNTMAKDNSVEIQKFADHHVITQANPLRKVLRRVPEEDRDDPVARAEKALADLSGEFKNWMVVESERLFGAPGGPLQGGVYNANRGEAFRA